MHPTGSTSTCTVLCHKQNLQANSRKSGRRRRLQLRHSRCPRRAPKRPPQPLRRALRKEGPRVTQASKGSLEGSKDERCGPGARRDVGGEAGQRCACRRLRRLQGRNRRAPEGGC